MRPVVDSFPRVVSASTLLFGWVAESASIIIIIIEPNKAPQRGLSGAVQLNKNVA